MDAWWLVGGPVAGVAERERQRLLGIRGAAVRVVYAAVGGVRAASRKRPWRRSDRNPASQRATGGSFSAAIVSG